MNIGQARRCSHESTEVVFENIRLCDIPRASHSRHEEKLARRLSNNHNMMAPGWRFLCRLETAMVMGDDSVKNNREYSY